MEKGIYNSWSIKLIDGVLNFCLITAYFLTLNIPIIIWYFLVVLNPAANPGLILTYVCLLPIVPAFSTVISMINDIICKKDMDNISKRFFKYYKGNFSQSIFVGAIGNFILMILYVDIKFINTDFEALFYIIGAVVFVIMNYALIYITRFYMSIKNIMKLAYISSFKYMLTSISIICALIMGIFLIYKFNYIGIIILPIVFAVLLIYLCKKPVKDIENILSK